MAKVYLGLGTNLGDKEQNLRSAVEKINSRIGEVISLSGCYITSPWGFTSTNSFLNAAVCIETNLCPPEVLKATQEIEKEIGRINKSLNGIYSDRLIDIDLLLYDNAIIDTNELKLPHPLMTEREFVMKPLAEIAPNVIHPIARKTLEELSLSIGK